MLDTSCSPVIEKSSVGVMELFCLKWPYIFSSDNSHRMVLIQFSVWHFLLFMDTWAGWFFCTRCMPDSGSKVTQRKQLITNWHAGISVNTSDHRFYFLSWIVLVSLLSSFNCLKAFVFLVLPFSRNLVRNFPKIILEWLFLIFIVIAVFSCCLLFFGKASLCFYHKQLNVAVLFPIKFFVTL